MKRKIEHVTVIMALIFFIGMSGSASAQDQSDQGDQNQAENDQSSQQNQPYQIETPEQLQRLVAPIALYPDSLLASILAASSYPAQISEANTWLAPRLNMSPEELASEADKQSWDPSVKELLPFPPVLENLSSNLSWTSELGDAYFNQQTELMDAIQEMRRQAKKAGTLKSNDQIHVTDSHGHISIDPAMPEDNEVYVPAYDPWAVYGYPIDPWPGWVSVPGVWWGGPGLDFGIGFGIGPYLGFGWGWNRWGFDWDHRGLYFGGRPYFPEGPAFFNRYNYYHGYPGFGYRPSIGAGVGRGFDGRPGLRSGAFGGYDHGGATRGFSSRGQGSMGGGFHGGGFSGGGFHGGGGGGFHGGGGGGGHR